MMLDEHKGVGQIGCMNVTFSNTQMKCPVAFKKFPGIFCRVPGIYHSIGITAVVTPSH